MKNIFLGFCMGLGVIVVGIAVTTFLTMQKSKVNVTTLEPEKLITETPENKASNGSIEFTLDLPEPLKKNWDPRLLTLLGKVVDTDSASTQNQISYSMYLNAPSSFPSKVTINLQESILKALADRPKAKYRLELEHCSDGYPACVSKIRARVDLPLNLSEELRLRSPILLGKVNFSAQVINEDPKVKSKDCNAGQIQAKVKIVSTDALLQQIGDQNNYLLIISDESSLGPSTLGSTRVSLAAKEVSVAVKYTAQKIEFGVIPRLIPCGKNENDANCLEKLEKFRSQKRKPREGPFIPGSTAILPVARNFVVGKCNIDGTTYFAHSYGAELPTETLPAEIVYSR